MVLTGRSRWTLFFVRIPAALAVCFAFTTLGFLVAAVGAAAFAGSAPALGVGLMLKGGAWLLLANGIVWPSSPAASGAWRMARRYA